MGGLPYVLGRKYYCLKLAIVPFGDIGEIQRFRNVDSRLLELPQLGNTRFDAIVADLRADMPDEWAKFLGDCAISGIPVYHSRQMLEQLTGRVKIKHLSENVFGTLQPSAFYGIIKRCIDIFAVILLLPIVVLILIIVGILIKLDSKGPIFYIQKRIGYKNKIFEMYKLRSMRIDLAGKGFTEQGEDPRITRIGKVIRKYRIDELPQLLNVLKGDMSFIGPRPESLDLSVWYEKEVPFFSYRHIVRPGISGWAQVTQGYAAEVEGMTTKLQYDFYYIKHFSFWLDVLIVFKTIKTMLTGFGAR
ncbi:sugar transferase [Wohlfahrtiimonas chitiniclastica]|uniref:sugar transferase n=1 Tax=Wohlfahrtiimonas chitiniclastica TaxID=400946 RepID=UPI001BCE0749|nr:sugar transferase [Wohlfahrtiimonas chitiniclastica]MBS7836982.1 sugar transferase [Wohlfahrtiimonas chitiniclastica]